MPLEVRWKPELAARIQPGELQSRQRDQNNSAIQSDSLKRRRKIAKAADKMHSSAQPATSTCHDLSCQHVDQAIVFYLKLSSCQPRATLKIKK
jgi:hypothetical protein